MKAFVENGFCPGFPQMLPCLLQMPHQQHSQNDTGRDFALSTFRKLVPCDFANAFGAAFVADNEAGDRNKSVAKGTDPGHDRLGTPDKTSVNTQLPACIDGRFVRSSQMVMTGFGTVLYHD